MSIGNGQVILENSPDSFNLDGISHLIVIKFSLSATNNSDTISVYLDPTNIVEPELASGTLSGQNFTLGNLGPVNMFGSDGNTDMVADEMRISKAADSTPEEIAAAFALVIPALPLPGDCDGDDDVDIDDYNIIAANYNTFTPGGPASGDVALANASQGVDGFVGIADYRLVARQLQSARRRRRSGSPACHSRTVELVLCRLRRWPRLAEDYVANSRG